MLKITAASFVWAGGQHNDAMRPLAMLAYMGPIAAAVVVSLHRNRAGIRRSLLVCLVALLGFALAQAVTAHSYIRLAKAAAVSMPGGGKEGWYWYSLAPLWATLAIGLVLITLRPTLAAIFAGWIVAWDIVISEGALFRDYAGVTSPEHGGMLFRWGPAKWSDIPRLGTLLRDSAVGPLTSSLLALRLVQIACLALATTIVLRHSARQIVDLDQA